MRIVVAGAGSVGTFVAAELIEAGHEVVIVESDAGVVAEQSAKPRLSAATWVQVDACEVSKLAEAQPESADVVVALTGDDEDNLVISLLAKQEFAVPRVLARVNHPENEWLFDESWGVDVAVSTPHLLTALVEEAVSVGTLVRLFSFDNGNAQLVEVTLAPNSPAVGRSVEQVGFPRGSTAVAVVRGGSVVVPRGDTMLYADDEVLVLVTGDTEPEVRSLLVG